MARQRLLYKTYPVSTRVDPRGVFYGLVQGTTTEPETSLREIMAFKKITAFDPKQVVNLVEDIMQGGLELTALDGRPRAISSLMKTYLGFDGSFPTVDARVTDQKLVARIRLLKDLRIEPNMDNFTLVNTLETGPEIDTILSPGGTPWEIIKSRGILVTGRNLYFDATKGDTASITWGEGAEETTISITPTESDYSHMLFGWPVSMAEVDPNTLLTFTFRTRAGVEGGAFYTVIKTATLVAAT